MALWRFLSELKINDTSEDFDPLMQKKMRLWNLIYLSLVICGLSYFIFSLVNGMFTFAFFCGLFTLGLFSLLFLSKGQKHLLSRFLCLVLLHSATFFFSLSFGGESEFHIGHLIFMGLPFLLFQKHEWSGILLGIFLPITLFCILSWLNYPQYFSFLGELPPAFRTFNLTFAFIFSIILPFYLYLENQRSEVYLLDKVKEKMAELQESKDTLEQKVEERTRQLQESTERFRQMAESVREAFWMSSMDKKEIFYMSPAVEKIWGRPASFYQKNPEDWTKAIHPEDRAIVQEDFKNLQEGNPYSRHYRIIRPSGELRWIWERANCLYSPDGKVGYICGVASDITDQKETELTMADQRLKMAAASKMSALGEMAGAIAHEINNPLMMIHGKAGQLRELAEEGSIGKEIVIEFTSKIEATVMRISKIVSSLKYLTRDGSKDMLEIVSLKSIIEDTLELCMERSKKKDVEIKVHPIPDSIQIETRGNQIAQVILNLLNNSFDAVEELTEKWVEIKVEEVKEGEPIRIMIMDSGPGIPIELQEKIFVPFFTSKPVGKGTGLGLNISKKIIQKHKGSLRIDSSLPHTCFVLHLPFNKKIQKSSDNLTKKA